MNVSHPIRGIIPTLDAPVLEVLAGTTRGLSGREVHRLAGIGSVRGVQLVLARLLSQGLVLADEHASATLYTASRAHVAWPALEALVGLRGRFLERLGEDVAGWTITPLHLSIFGSAARRDGDAESDIDVLIVRPDAPAEGDEVWDSQIDALRDRVAAWTGNRCQALDIDRVRLGAHLAAGDPIVEEWLRDGHLVFGAPLRSLLDGLAAAAQPVSPARPAEPRRAAAPTRGSDSVMRSRSSSSPISSSTSRTTRCLRSPAFAASLAVLAGIAAADASCCAALGRRGRGQNHDEAVALVRTIVPRGEAMARDLARLLALKDDAQYGVLIVSPERARSSVGWARRLVAAREVVGPAG